ncbi:hypothetical protein ACF8EA_24515 [Pseudomonas sp. YQ_5]|uniref:hypothetical protein n=1 Tax=Pseudomonas sp. YQ_5 TaxID=3367229 RepID=UPI00370B3F05
MSVLTKEDIAAARKIFESKGVGDMYDYMAMKGDRYAVLANGVANRLPCQKFPPFPQGRRCLLSSTRYRTWGILLMQWLRSPLNLRGLR